MDIKNIFSNRNRNTENKSSKFISLSDTLSVRKSRIDCIKRIFDYEKQKYAVQVFIIGVKESVYDYLCEDFESSQKYFDYLMKEINN